MMGKPNSDKQNGGGWEWPDDAGDRSPTGEKYTPRDFRKIAWLFVVVAVLYLPVLIIFVTGFMDSAPGLQQILSLVILAVGEILLIWGAVNYFKKARRASRGGRGGK